ncbi:unnamed protein product, partial [marine sediment metagenome]
GIRCLLKILQSSYTGLLLILSYSILRSLNGN